MKNWKNTIFIVVPISVGLAFFVTAHAFEREDNFSIPAVEVVAEVPEKVQTEGMPLSVAVAGNAAEAVPLQLQYLPFGNYYTSESDRKVTGLALGYVLQQKEIDGLALACINAYNEKKNGLSLSMIEISGDSRGVAMFLIGGNIANNGLSMGVWNMTENNNGLQIGIFNQAEANLMVEHDFKPEQNKSETFGVQAGLINYSDAPGIQFGLWNTNPNSLIKHFPLFNICL